MREGGAADEYGAGPDTLLSMCEYTLDTPAPRTDAIETDAAADQNYFEWNK